MSLQLQRSKTFTKTVKFTSAIFLPFHLVFPPAYFLHMEKLSVTVPPKFTYEEQLQYCNREQSEIWIIKDLDPIHGLDQKKKYILKRVPLRGVLIAAAQAEKQVFENFRHENLLSCELMYQETGDAYGAHDAYGAQCFVLPYAAGGDLFEYLNKYPVTTAQIQFLFKQVMQGVKYIEDQKFVHRDLKLENFLLSDHGPNPKLWISDFGFTISWTELKDAEQAGTPLYFAPEIAQRKPAHASASDIWSSGIVLGLMTSSLTPPFLEGDLLRGKVVANREFLRLKRKFDPTLRELLDWMLQIDPKKRPTAGQVLQHKWLQ